MAHKILHVGRGRIVVIINHRGQQNTVTLFEVDYQTTIRRREADSCHPD